MSLIFGFYEVEPSSTAVLFSRLSSKMAEDGDLDPKNSTKIETIIGFESQVRPLVSIWGVVVFFSVFFLLILLGLITKISSFKIFPIRKLLGEMNVASIALFSKNPKIAGNQYWISLEKEHKNTG